MRFFKYLVFIFLSGISVSAFAATVYYFQTYPATTYNTLQDACSDYPRLSGKHSSGKPNPNGANSCLFYNASGALSGSVSVLSKTICPAKDTMSVFFFNKDSTSVPQRRCIDGCTYEYQGGPVTDYPNSKMVTLWATGNSTNCTDSDSDSPNNNTPPCDFKDPYGGCYVPPDDKCIRLKDGSITCPETSPPPKNNTCNGATYCKRPPEGCGEGYVSGSFNGEQLCVRSGPNKPSDPPKPDDPQDPNNCMNGGSYCPQPPDNASCPAGYTETTFNGSKICVKNNPDPDKPNPNDPNTDGGGGASEPTGGGDGGTGGGVIDVKGIIDAINSLKAALLSAIDGVSKKLTTIIDAQKETNKKLDTSNDHLDKIEDSTRASSEGIGETNKKLDKIFSDEGKEQIEQLGEQSSDPRYAQAEAEATTQVQKFANVLSYTSSHACISDLTVTNIPLYGSMTVPLSKWCDLLALVKILMKLAVLMLALRMIDATVRAF